MGTETMQVNGAIIAPEPVIQPDTCYIISYDDPLDLQFGVRHRIWAPRTVNPCPCEQDDYVFFYNKRHGSVRGR